MPTKTVDGLNLHYETHGEGCPFVLAHGYCASIQMWKHQIRWLAERYRVIAYDARGHGLSSAPPDAGDYSLEQLVDDLKSLLDQLGIEQAYLAGHSMGGATVAGFTARYPHRVHATFICNIDAGHQPPEPEGEQQAQEDRERNCALVRARGLSDYARHQLESGAAPRFVSESEDERQAYIERYARQPANGFFAVGEARPWTDSWLTEAAASLTGPVAIIAGTDDVMHQGAEALHLKLTQSRFISIEDAPHDSGNARPEAFNQAIRDYLDALESGGELAGRCTL